MRYINDGKYLPGDKTTENDRQKNPREHTVEFFQTKSPDSFPDSSAEVPSFWKPVIRVLLNITEDEELFVHYRSSYYFTISKM